MAESSLLLQDNPLLLPLNKEKTIYDGFITVQEKDFRIRILLPSDRQLKNSKLQCCWRLKRLLYGYQHVMKKRLQHSADLVSFILELKTVLEVAVKRRGACPAAPPPQYYCRLIGEIGSLGWDKLLFLDGELRSLKLQAHDSSGRQHVLALKLKAKHPAEAPECSADLPLPLNLTWTPQSTLLNIHTQFLSALEALQEFWAVLDEIDERTWVLEPEDPPRAATMRRIAIGNNVSIKLEIDSRHPKMLPECCLLGAEHIVTPLRSKLNSNMHLWNPECSVLQNLKDVLEIEFPSPATHTKSSLSAECGICYSYRLDSAIPDQVCGDLRCGQPFHQACLYETGDRVPEPSTLHCLLWLRGLSSSRQSFNTIFGECPYCSKPVTVKVTLQKP